MKNLKIVVSAILIFAVLAGIGYALAPPPPPTVPQTIGLNDTSINFLVTTDGPNPPGTNQSACRQCHQSIGTNLSGTIIPTAGGVPTRHHRLVQAGVTNPYTGSPFGCQDCHPTTTQGGNILLDRSCLDCHNGSNFWADVPNAITRVNASVGKFSRPHHVITNYTEVVGFGNPAADRQCKVCHGSFVDNYNDGHYKPTYDTDFFITPFASFKATNISQPDLLPAGQGGNMNNILTRVMSASPTGGFKVWGGCYSCHLSNYNATPQPIGSNHDNHHFEILGVSASRGGGGYKANATPFDLSNPQTPGYNISTGVGRPCFVCHVVTPSGGPLEINITDGGTGITTTDSSGMEVRNSTVEATSAIEFVSVNGSITYNGTGCEKCHSVASLHNIAGSGGYVQNGPQGLGHINNNTDCYGCHNSWLPADTWTPGALAPTVDSISPSVIAADTATTVTITGVNFVNDVYTSVVTVDGVTYTPTSVTDTQITVDIPALAAGTHVIQLVKGGNTLSKLSVLTVVPVVTLTSATFDGTTLTLQGSGFGAEPTTNPEQYVLINHAGDLYYSATITSWTDTQIKATGTIVAGDSVQLITGNSGQAASPITVTTPPTSVLTTITVTPTTASVAKGASQTFTAVAKDQFGNTMNGVTISWSSSNTNVGTVNPSSGTTTTFTVKQSARKGNKATVKAQSGDISGTATVTVK